MIAIPVLLVVLIVLSLTIGNGEHYEPEDYYR